MVRTWARRSPRDDVWLLACGRRVGCSGDGGDVGEVFRVDLQVVPK